ncbi:MAG: amino acid permease [Clostridia bacterium]|nr:amino acid permease [Clostridia bacterium]
MNNLSENKQEKKIAWYMLAFMGFSTVWGFGNVTNGFMYFNGIQVIFSWILMFALYFIPYALMVGELGSAFKNSSGGVSSWIEGTYGRKMAYYAGWTYWAVHVTYIASKGSGGLKALSWAVFRNAEVYDALPTLGVQLATLAVFLLFCYIASRGMKVLKGITTLAGSTMFVMSILFILMMFAAPVINPNGGYVSMDFSLKNLVPQFNVNYFTSLSILVFAVGGCEKISPYVNKVDKPSKNFPRGMISLAIMVVVCAILGTIALGMMFDPAVIGATDESFNSYVSNGAYWAFQKMGQYYGVGDFFLVIYAVCNAIGQFSTLVISIDAPLRMLLGNDYAREFIPSAMLKQNKHGAYINGIKLVVVLSGAIILIQIVVPGATAVLTQLTKLNSVCMPMRYLWVFIAYIGLRRNIDKIPAEYRFVKNQKLALFFGYWCTIVTAACCIMGMYSKDAFTMILNIVTPCVLVGLGMIMPYLAKREREKK